MRESLDFYVVVVCALLWKRAVVPVGIPGVSDLLVVGIIVWDTSVYLARMNHDSIRHPKKTG